MPRIEQLPNGSYVRKLNYVEDEIIKRLYQEVDDRKAGDLALDVRVQTVEEQLTTALAEIDNLKLRILALEGK